MEILLYFALILLFLVFEGFFSGSEIGIVSADRMKLRHDAAKGSKGARLALKMLQKPEWLLSTTLVGTNIFIVANTTLITALMVVLFGEQYSWLAVAIAAPLIWIFGEIVPKSVFQQRANVITPYSIFVIRFFSIVFYPILFVSSRITRLLVLAVGGGSERNPFTLREEIVSMFKMPSASTKGDIEPIETEMIRRMFNFTETTVGNAMRPLIEVVAIDKQATCGEARRLATEKSHIRLPVYEERVDRIIGMLHVLDLLGEPDERPITDFIRDAQYVPASQGVRELLLQLRKVGEVVAVVVDEFGAAEGIIAVEDIVEEVVEDLSDEYDTKDSSKFTLHKLDDSDYVISGRAEIEWIQEKFDIELPDGDYTTLAGLILDKTRSIPREGTSIHIDNIILTVHRSSARAIREVRIRWGKQARALIQEAAEQEQNG